MADSNKNNTFSRTRHTKIGAILIQISNPRCSGPTFLTVSSQQNAPNKPPPGMFYLRQAYLQHNFKKANNDKYKASQFLKNLVIYYSQTSPYRYTVSLIFDFRLWKLFLTLHV